MDNLISQDVKLGVTETQAPLPSVQWSNTFEPKCCLKEKAVARIISKEVCEDLFSTEVFPTGTFLLTEGVLLQCSEAELCTMAVLLNRMVQVENEMYANALSKTNIHFRLIDQLGVRDELVSEITAKMSVLQMLGAAVQDPQVRSFTHTELN